MDIEEVYKDKNLIAVNKPAGLLVHPIHSLKGHSLAQNSLINWLLPRYPEVAKVGDKPQERPGIVHRLDRDTSGVLLVARNQATFDYLKHLFQSHEVKKTYQALVFGKTLQGGVVDKPIGLRPGTTKRSVSGRNMKMIKEAITGYRTLQHLEKDGQPYSFVELQPKTGRTHQLRIHMASIEHPIVGDQLYGRKPNPWGLSRQFLHAASLEFTTPDGKRLRLEAELPLELRAILDSCSKDTA